MKTQSHIDITLDEGVKTHPNIDIHLMKGRMLINT